MAKANDLAAALHNEVKETKRSTPLKTELEGGSVQINCRVDPAAKKQLEFLRLEIGAKSL